MRLFTHSMLTCVTRTASLLIAGTLLLTTNAQAQDNTYHEANRPQMHFTPKAHWINDPNGLLYLNGKYHLFYQYYPEAINWGPMHWGHAVSKDLIHWHELPIALYPDSLGYIFSGSAVFDQHNTSGLGTAANPPMVAIFTHHDPAREKGGSTDVERQSIAYSLDEGKTWTKYAGNPVVDNPGVRDFRDPKVIWYAPENKWIMVVAASDRVRLYASKNLKQWTEISQFGKDRGSHGSVWECPDLFPMKAGKQTKWVLTVCEGNGGPNKGSGIQYFIGDFDGKAFKSEQTEARWLEAGPDDYAGNTWNNTRGRRLYIGWMTNLMYAGNVPASSWRGQMTIPRTLELDKVDDKYYLMQRPVAALQNQIKDKIGVANIAGRHGGVASLSYQANGDPVLLNIEQKKQNSGFELLFSSASGDTLKLGFDLAKNKYYIDRQKAGDMGFASGMDGVLWAPRVVNAASTLQVLLDRNSIEVFADKGTAVMTALYYPKSYFDKVQLSKPDGTKQDVKISMDAYTLKSIWADQQ